MGKEIIREKHVSTLEDYLKIIKDVELELRSRNNDQMVLFRGQSNDHPLYPRIAREEYHVLERQIVEFRIFNEFKRLCIPHIENSVLTDWDYLALAQHYSLPTRLLDWTENPLIALWFAMNRRPKFSSSEGRTVWCYSVNYDEIVNSSTGSPFD